MYVIETDWKGGTVRLCDGADGSYMFSRATMDTPMMFKTKKEAQELKKKIGSMGARVVPLASGRVATAIKELKLL